MLRSLALLFLWCAGVASATVVDSLGGAPPAKKFSHREHVPAVWFEQGDAETWRDCRGCHRFGQGGLIDKHRHFAAHPSDRFFLISRFGGAVSIVCNRR